jgi:hypothetical protein
MADEAGACELWGGLRFLVLTLFAKQGAFMGNLMAKCARLHAQGHQWLKREEERVGVLLWAVGITILASLPLPGCSSQCTRRFLLD